MDRRSRRNPEWKRGLRKGLLGLMLVLGAFFWRKNQETGQQIRTGSDAVRSADVDPVAPAGRDTKRIALTFDDDVIIGLSQEISYKEAVSMI